MEYSRVLGNKSQVYNIHAKDHMLDLLDSTFKLQDDYNSVVINISEDDIARLDLVALKVYGDEMYSDILAKLNGISNPYELNKNMKIVCPDTEFLNSFIQKPSKAWSTDVIGQTVSKSYLDGEDRSLGAATANEYNEFITTDKVINKLVNSTNKKGKSNSNKPNGHTSGDARYTIQGSNSIIIY